MSNSKKEWISNWLISSIENESTSGRNYEIPFTNSNINELQQDFPSKSIITHSIEKQLNSNYKCVASSNIPEATDSSCLLETSASTINFHNKEKKSVNAKRAGKRKLKKVIKNKNLKNIVEDCELTISPVSGTFIIKDWNSRLKNKFINEQHNNVSKPEKSVNKFTNDEVMLNSVASNYVQITDEAKLKLSKIVNCIGPYECKLCKIIYSDPFELAMHNCPRVVHYEYRYE